MLEIFLGGYLFHPAALDYSGDTCRNARKDKYFAAKTTDAARINGQLFRITRITGTPTEWRVFIAP